MSHSEDKMPQTNEGSGTSPVAQQQQQPQHFLHQSASPADHSCGKHQTAAVFDSEVAKEAAAVDQEAGATVEEADAPGCRAELPQNFIANQLVTSNEQPTAPPAADASSLASIGPIRSQPLRSSSRQSQAKSAPWR